MFTRRRLVILLGLVVFVIFLVGMEKVCRRLLPGIKPYRELINFGPRYPAVYSNYLPFTTPINVTIRDSYGFGSVEYNQFGYRGPTPRTLETDPGTTRILFMGDSFTLGWGVKEEESFIGQIRSKLTGRQSPVEPIDGGYHDGYSPDAYYAYLRREGIALHPDVVVVVIYSGNDVEDIADNKWVSTDELNAPDLYIQYGLIPTIRADN